MRLIRDTLFVTIFYIFLPGVFFYAVYIFTENHEAPIYNTLRYLQIKASRAFVYAINDFSAYIGSDKKLNSPTLEIHNANEITIFETIKKKDLKRNIEQEEDINKIGLEFFSARYKVEDVLNDKHNRISSDFKIPDELLKRVRFWFDVYTRYSSRFSIIHDIDRPWIVYDIVDGRPFWESADDSNATKDANERIAINKSLKKTRTILANLAKKKDYTSLSENEQRIYKLFDDQESAKPNIFKNATYRVRSQRGQKDMFRKGITFSSKYLSDMEKIFAENDLPVELVRLPLVESSFNEFAQSKVGASGVWQFMPDTGKKFLTVGKVIDERNSPLKATQAAAKLMLSNFKVLKNWPLAITAYNHGAGGLSYAQKKLKTDSIIEIIEKYHSPSFGFASENFYCEFLAALHAERYHEEIFGPIFKYPPLNSESIDLKRKMRAKTLLEVVGITLEELKLFNPELKHQTVTQNTFLPAGFHLRLPLGRKVRLELFSQQEDET